MQLTTIGFKRLSLAVLIAASFGLAQAACVEGAPSTFPSVDVDADGIPDYLESLEGKQFCVKDNDIFNQHSLFVKQAYRDFLGRESDAAGVAYWNGLLTNGTQTSASVIQTFMQSGEFQAKAAPITRLYKAYFNRMPDHEGLWYWVALFGNGKTVADIAQTFSESPEFKAQYGQVANDAFVDLVYQNVLGRVADAAGKAYWLGLLDAGKQSRGEMMIGFSESAEHVSTSTPHVNLVLAYEGLLRRNVGAEDYTAGMIKLQTGVPFTTLLSELMSSNEYKARFIRLPEQPKEVGGLNDTGIGWDKCLQADSVLFVDCHSAEALAFNPSQDGMLGRAAASENQPSAGFSFTKLDADGYPLPATATRWACVKDNITGLIWENKTDDGGLHDKNHTYTHYDNINLGQKPNGIKPTQAEVDAPNNSVGFLNRVNAEGLCGAKDWIIPRLSELSSIVHFGKELPAVDSGYFPNLMPNFSYWTQSNHAIVEQPGAVWVVNFEKGVTGLNYRENYHFSSVVLVRAPATPTIARYVPIEDGNLLVDNQTQLVWQRCAVGMQWNGLSCAGEATLMTYAAAMTLAKDTALTTEQAWRVPNIKELQSIVDTNMVMPAVDSMLFPATPVPLNQSSFWSSTPSISLTNQNWVVDFALGNTMPFGGRKGTYPLRLVRNR